MKNMRNKQSSAMVQLGISYLSYRSLLGSISNQLESGDEINGNVHEEEEVTFDSNFDSEIDLSDVHQINDGSELIPPPQRETASSPESVLDIEENNNPPKDGGPNQDGHNYSCTDPLDDNNNEDDEKVSSTPVWEEVLWKRLTRKYDADFDAVTDDNNFTQTATATAGTTVCNGSDHADDPFWDRLDNSATENKQPESIHKLNGI